MFRRFETSRTEIIDITKAWVAISIAFAIVLSNRAIFTGSFFFNLLLAALTVGIGFLFHELSHKVVAQRYGAVAEFRAFDYMLVLAIAMSFLGFIFAAPGAVMIAGGHINIKRNGKISAAGPITNLVLALIFLIIMKLNFSNAVNLIGKYGFLINSWLALFNMLPFWNFDGRKIFVWSKLVWASVVAVAIIFLFVLSPGF